MMHCKRTVTKVQCVVSENSHIPRRRDWKFLGRGGGGGLKGQKIELNVRSLTGISREMGSKECLELQNADIGEL